MKAQAEVSLYPLRRNDLTGPIQQFAESVKSSNVNVKTGTMSTFISGDSRTVFQGVQRAFEQAARKYQVVLTMKISNACPEIK